MESRQRILVIDDDLAMREVLTEELEMAGYEASSASGVDEGLDQIRRGVFRLVLSDVNMPGKNGFDLLEGVSALGGRPAVVLMSSFASEWTAERARAAGAIDFLRKPFGMEALVEVVERSLGL